MSVAYVIEFKVRNGERERFLGLITEVLDTMAHEANYRAATLHEDPADPNRFLLREVWVDHEDVVNVQLHRPYRRAWHAALPELLEGERRIEVWKPVRGWVRDPSALLLPQTQRGCSQPGLIPFIVRLALFPKQGRLGPAVCLHRQKRQQRKWRSSISAFSA